MIFPEANTPGAETEGINPGADLSIEAEEFYLAIGIMCCWYSGAGG
jgi:hypothetical protein